MTAEERKKLMIDLSNKIANTTTNNEDRQKAIKLLNILNKTKPKAPDIQEFDF